MSFKKSRVAVMGLAASSTMALTLGIVLPLVIKSSQLNPQNHVTSEQRYQTFDGLNKTTEYTVGENITFSLEHVSVPDEYSYQWYLQTVNQSEPLLYQTTTVPKLTLSDLGTNLNDAKLSCLLVPKADAVQAKENFLTYSTKVASLYNQSTVQYYTETQLLLSAPYSISSCDITVNPSSVKNGVILDTKDNIVLDPKGQTVVLFANVQTQSVYSGFVKYQWYCNGKALANQTNSSLTINSSNIEDDTYYCETYLLAGDNKSASVKSDSIQINVVASTDLSNNNPVNVTVGNKLITNGQVVSGNTVKLTTSFKLGTQEINPSNANGYKVTYTWYHNHQVINQPSSSPDLTIHSATATDSGSYQCKATITYNGGGSVSATSQSININVNQPDTISISHNLFNQTITNGDSATLSVNASVGHDPHAELNYTWKYKLPTNSQWETISGNNTNTLNISAKDAATIYDGAQFQCTVSAVDPNAEIQPVNSLVMTLNDVNPEFNVSTSMSPSSGLMYGENVTLTAYVTSIANPKVTDPSFVTKYGYQWYVQKVNGQWDLIPADQGGHQQSLTIKNLSSANNGTKYRCFVYPANAIETSTVGWEKVGKLTGNLNLNVNAYQFTTNIEVTPSSGSGVVTKTGNAIAVKNNLGDTFSLAANVSPENYADLPTGYTYSYQWQRAVSSTAKEDQWQNIGSESTIAGSETLSNITSNTAGVWYYRCVVKIVKAGDSSASPLGTSNSNCLETATYPKVIITPQNNQPNVTIAHNGKTVLAPTIKLQTSLGDNDDFVPNDQVPVDLAACGATYQWTYNGQVLTSSNIDHYPFIKTQDINQPQLGINTNSFHDEHDTVNMCHGTYSLSININGQTYSMSTPYTVSEQLQPTYSVTVDPIIVNEGATTLPLKAQVKFLNPTSQHDTFTYNWFVKYPYPLANSSVRLDVWQELGSHHNNLPTLNANLKNHPVSSSWENKVEFYCEVIDNNTNEVEWNTVQPEFKVNVPQIREVKLSGKNLKETRKLDTVTANAGQTISVTATAPKVSLQLPNSSLSFTWQYLDNGQWKNITSGGIVGISSNTDSSTLTLSDANVAWNNHLKLRCLASYGNSLTTYASKASKEVDVYINETTLPQISDGQMFSLINGLQTNYLNSNDLTKLYQAIGLTTGTNNPQLHLTPAFTSYLYKMLGFTNPQQIQDMFGNNPIQISQFIVPPIQKNNTGAATMFVEPESYTVDFEFTFTLNKGYKWNLESMPKSWATVDGQQLHVYVASGLTHSFKVLDTTATPVTVSSTNSNISMSVKSTKNINNFAWYIVNKTTNKPIVLTPNNENSLTSAFKSLFGSNAKVSINNSGTTSTLNISGITANSELSSVRIYAVGTLEGGSNYFEQAYNVNPFIINVK